MKVSSLIVCALLLFVSSKAVTFQDKPASGVMEIQELRLIDENGKLCAFIAAKEGGGVLQLFGESGPRLSFHVQNDGRAVLSLKEPRGRSAIQLSVLEGGDVEMRVGNESASLSYFTIEGNGEFRIQDEASRAGIYASISNGIPNLKMRDTKTEVFSKP